MFHSNFLMINWLLSFICCKPTVSLQRDYWRQLGNTSFHSNNPDVICLPKWWSWSEWLRLYSVYTQYIFSLYSAVFRLYSVIYGYPVSLFNLILIQRKTTAQPLYAFICTQEANPIPYCWLRLQKNSFQVTEGTDHSWKPFSNRCVVPFVLLQNTMAKNVIW